MYNEYKEEKMTVYIDLYILTNLLLNFIILRIAKAIIKSESSNLRLFISSFIGSLFAILLLFPANEKITSFTGKFILSLIMTAISFSSKNIKTFFKALASFYFSSFIVGGCGFALYNLIETSEFFSIEKLLCITILLSYIILNAVYSVYKKHYKYDNLIHKLKINLKDKTAETLCYYDTGNNLQDPITATPVIITNIKTAKKLLPDDIIYALMHNTDIIKIYMSYCMRLKLRLIPYNTISGQGLILAFTPDKVYVDEKETKAIIGISCNLLSSENEYDAILNPKNI